MATLLAVLAVYAYLALMGGAGAWLSYRRQHLALRARIRAYGHN